MTLNVVDGVGLSFVFHDRQNGTEDLFLHQCHVLGHVQHDQGHHLARAGQVLRSGVYLDDPGPLGAGVFHQGRDPREMAFIDDAGVVGIVRQARVHGGHLSAHVFHEGILCARRDKGIVRLDAGLAGVEQLAVDDGGSRADQGIIRRHDGRGLATQFEGHGHQVGRGRFHHQAADTGCTGKQQVVEGQAAEGLSHLRTTGDHGNLLLVEYLAEGLLQKLGGQRGQFRRFQHDAVARRQGAGHGAQGQLNRVVPGRDHAHATQGLVHDDGTAGQEGQGGGPAFRTHPLADLGPSLADGLQYQVQLGPNGLVPGPVAEVTGYGIAEVVAVFPDDLFEPRQRIPPLADVRRRGRQKGFALSLQDFLHGVRILGHDSSVGGFNRTADGTPGPCSPTRPLL